MSRETEVIELLEAIIKHARFEEVEGIEIMAAQALALLNQPELKSETRKVKAAPALLAVCKDALKNMDCDAVLCLGDWETGMFCGLEDSNINDIYQACNYGYEKALERVQEWVLCGFEEAIAEAGEK